MSSDFVITEEMKQVEARAWKIRLSGVMGSRPLAREIRTGEKPRFVNNDSAAPLRAFDRSEAADAALEAALEIGE